MSKREQRKQRKLARAIAIASEAHQGQFDRGGRPYILHCLTVMHKVKSKDFDPELKQIAVLHDLIEDCSDKWSIARLEEEGFSQRVRDALSLLTHQKGVSYDAYIKGIATNIDAIRVKLADLRHNSDIMRLKGVSDKDTARMVKYHKAWLFLEAELAKLECPCQS